MPLLRSLSYLIPAPALLIALTVTSSARADALPPNSCESVSDVGAACNNAGTNDEPGVCVASLCNVLDYADAGEGGPGTTQIPCAICEQPDVNPAIDAGSPGADAGNPVSDAGNPKEPTADAGTKAAAPSDTSSSGGCAMTPFHQEQTVGGLMLGLGLAAVAWGRRKKQS